MNEKLNDNHTIHSERKKSNCNASLCQYDVNNAINSAVQKILPSKCDINRRLTIKIDDYFHYTNPVVLCYAFREVKINCFRPNTSEG